MEATVKKVWDILVTHTPDVGKWDAEAQGELAVTIAHRLRVRGERPTVETVLHHFVCLEED